MSSKAIIERLKKQLPRRVPKAKSGSPTRAAELIPVTSSGIEVMAPRNIKPTQTLPRPVFSATASPYRASFVPENMIMATQERNFNQTKV